MENELNYYTVNNFTTLSGKEYDAIKLSYQLFGQELHTAPIVLVNHALTGNSNVACPESGWWKSLVGEDKVIDTNKYTVIAFNIPGNGFDGNIYETYTDFVATDIARLFIETLKANNISSLHAAIGGSLGGGVAWEIAALEPKLIKYLIPVASDWKTSDWIIGHNYIQEQLLKHSSLPLESARMMAMLFYRTPASFKSKFNRTKTDDNELFNVESWLKHHGDKLNGRFEPKAYQMMNHLLARIDIAGGQTVEKVLEQIESIVVQVAIDTDLFFVPDENVRTKELLDKLGKENYYHEISSLHGHDAFLIEYEQLNKILKPYF